MSERDFTKDPKYRSYNEVPYAFEEGNRVVKHTGDYFFRGIVLARFRKRSGVPRYNVENDDGVIHVFNHDQLELDDTE